MSISVTSLGTASDHTTSSSVTLSITVPAGALIVVGVSEDGSTIGTLADVNNGSYTGIFGGIKNSTVSGRGLGELFYFQNSRGLSAGTLTYTKQNNTNDATITALYATGIATTSALDTAVTAYKQSVSQAAAASVASGTPTQTGDLFVGFLSWASAAARTFTEDTGHGWTATGGLDVNTTLLTAQIGGGNHIASTSSITFAPSLSNVAYNTAFVVGFKPAVTATGLSLGVIVG